MVKFIKLMNITEIIIENLFIIRPILGTNFFVNQPRINGKKLCQNKNL